VFVAGRICNAIQPMVNGAPLPCRWNVDAAEATLERRLILACPAQMLWTASGQPHDVARFIVYDSISRLAAAVALIGGEGTSLEHSLNRTAHRIVGA
jgi:hypothetical protein